MLILVMLLKITGWTQEKLADFIGVSRVTLNGWLKETSNMTDSSKKNIADKFEFPVSYFDVDLSQDINLYKVIYSTLTSSWERINRNNSYVDVNSNEYKVAQIMNRIECETVKYGADDVSDIEILDGLVKGYDPFTGEVFGDDHIINNASVHSLLASLYNSYENGRIEITKDDLNDEQFELYEKLRKWRLAKTLEEGFHNAYMVFTNKELINIILADINQKADLRKVKGIGNIKYDKYADDLFMILSGEVENYDVDYIVHQKNPYETFGADIEITDEEFPL